MFGIDYDTWLSVCDIYFGIKSGTKKAYLQYYPFEKLTKSNVEKIKSEEFFDQNIKYGSFVQIEEYMYQTKHYLQKKDSSFRDAYLISPILFLVLQCIGKKIHDNYDLKLLQNRYVFYAGNYSEMKATYKKEYDNFYKGINDSCEYYQYFIKTDISNFFHNIDIDILIKQIDEKCNKTGRNSKIVFSQNELYQYKKLLSYCGNGKYPLIENSMATSYLASVVYLEKTDCKLYEYIKNKVPEIEDFQIFRYVDDMYILFNSESDSYHLKRIYNKIEKEYSSILREVRLSINSSKCEIKSTKDIDEELKRSLYDEYVYGEKCNIADLFQDTLLKFLRKLNNKISKENITVDEYNELINEVFGLPNVEYKPNEVFNYYVYNSQILSSEECEEIDKLVKNDISFISLDTKRLTVLILKTKNGKAIKSVLNKLFNKSKAGNWNCFDTAIANAYLIQRGFGHEDLLQAVSKHDNALYKWYLGNCIKVWLQDIEQYKRIPIIGTDWKTNYLYFMYLCENKKGNYMTAYAYYKNYFDRMTARIDWYFYDNYDKPNYKLFYKKGELKKFYSGSHELADEIIEETCKIRNSNPLSHASAGMIDKDTTTKEIKESIKALDMLMNQKINQNIESLDIRIIKDER
ncbi:abortive infection protein, AbiA family [Granulicatella balaenopterae]|uniref:Abortive infection protein, AbiA family n=1 Tax=Granulicatella balaenopterae TaxID=137733 RepID=A0A1H9LW56_9LACT|nr:AbiA family abortive infection protein [Granulicatella balaenopterae]SER15425.1 abortive infection protein, AbiA family [Granulicatella balaenopterae]